MHNVKAAAIAALVALGILALLGVAEAADNHTPETAEPLDQYNHINEYLNSSDSTKKYWYYMDIERGDELWIYFYGTGENPHRCRMLYYMRGPDTYDAGYDIHGEYWYGQRVNRVDYSDLWHWICPKDGRYYFHFYARARPQGATVGQFHCNISRDFPVEIIRFATDHDTLTWAGMEGTDRNDVRKIWLEAKENTVEGVEVTVTWSTAHRVHLYAYDLADEHEQNLLNMSWCYEGDNHEFMRFTASYTGWYYIHLQFYSWSGVVDYTIVTREYSAPNDGDNTPENATHVLKSSSIPGGIEASKDMHDWFTVDLYRDDILGISMQIMDPYNPAYKDGATNYRNFFEIQVYDPYMRKVSNGYDRNGGWPIPDTFINNLPIQPSDIKVDGTYYIRASFSHSYGYYYDPTNTTGVVIAPCNYVLQITIPNRPPSVNETTLEEVLMLEDTTWWENLAGENVTYLDLYAVFIDPEGGVVTFYARGDDNLSVNLQDEKLGLKPNKDWFGSAKVNLSAEDDSGNRAHAVLSVVVVPVNDAPRSMPEGLAIGFMEDEMDNESRTFNLYDLFYDVDPEDVASLNFTMPPWPGFSATIDNGTGNVTLTTRQDLNGAFELFFQARDTHLSAHIATVDVDVEPVNDAPRSLGEDARYGFMEGFSTASFDAADLLFDPDGDTGLYWRIEYVLPEDEDNLTVTNEGRDPANSVILLNPAKGRIDWYGTVLVTIACEDPKGLRGEQLVEILIMNTPDPPEIVEVSPTSNPTFGEDEIFTFSVLRVQDPDRGDPVFNYSWRLKSPGERDPVEVQNTSRNTYQMTTDYESEGVYELTVSAFDAEGLECRNPFTWMVTVSKTNRRPVIVIDSPMDNASFKKGDWVELTASASDDDPEDGANLIVEWYEEGKWVGDGLVYSSKSLSEGRHTFTVIVSDPDGAKAETSVTVLIKKEDDKGPGPTAGVAMAALFVVAVAYAARRHHPRFR